MDWINEYSVIETTKIETELFRSVILMLKLHNS